MKKPEFPKVVKIGQTRATIYETPSHDCTAYTVVWYEGAVRKRKAFAELESAELHATIKVNSLSQGEAQVVHLSGEDRLAYVRARDVIAEFGLALDTAATEYRDAKRLLRGGSLLEAARYFAAHRLHGIPRKMVPEVFAEMLKAKREEGLSERYLEDLDSRLGMFADAFQCQLASVTGIQSTNGLESSRAILSKISCASSNESQEI